MAKYHKLDRKRKRDKVRIGNVHIFGDVTFYLYRPQRTYPLSLGAARGSVTGVVSMRATTQLRNMFTQCRKHATTVVTGGSKHLGASYVTRLAVTVLEKGVRVTVNFVGTGRWQ